jgi:hypothetical protein
MIRVIALITAGFLFLSTLEVFAGYWLAGRWFVSSRFATVSLGIVKNWLDRGVISGATQTVKTFISKNGKWILLTLALSEVISEVQNLQSGSEYCYVSTGGSLRAGWLDYGRLVVHDSGNYPQNFYTASYSSPCYSGGAYIPSVEIRRWMKPWNSNSYQWVYYATVPAPGTYQIGNCSVTFSLKNVGIVCPSDNSAPSSDWQNERRKVPVRVFPNISDFVRPDMINSDPALSYLRDEYQRLASDNSIPTISGADLQGVELPEVSWYIPEEEALDGASEGSTSEGSASEGSQEQGEQSSDGSAAIPWLDTSLNVPSKRSFPVELVNSIIQSHPLLRVLRGVNLDVGAGGSCVIGSAPFQFDFCPYQGVLNIMGGVIVFVSFLSGLLWIGRFD